MDFSFNLLPVIITAFLLMPVGAFMYSSKGLGDEWLKAIGKTKEDIQNDNSNMALYMGGAFLSSLITIYLIGVLIHTVNAYNAIDLLLLVFVVYFIVFFIRLKGSIFDGNFSLFKVNLIATFVEFIVTFLVFLVFVLWNIQ